MRVTIIFLLSFLPLFGVYAKAINYQTVHDGVDNPGQLSAELLIQEPKAALVVLLHGCTQQGLDFARLSGFEELAQKHKFNLLVLSQNPNNNVQNCFNWFSEIDNQKDQGETLSIKNLIQTASAKTSSQSVYLVGLSAGGAMVSNVISHYPEMFTGAAMISGVPFPCASGLIQAIACMKNGPGNNFFDQHKMASSQLISNTVIISSVSDAVVNHKNSQAYVKAWLSAAVTAKQIQDSKNRKTKIQRWRSDEKSLHFVELDGLGHGLPVNASVDGGGKPEAYFIDNEFSTSLYLVEVWRL